jgi:hypothetical protein
MLSQILIAPSENIYSYMDIASDNEVDSTLGKCTGIHGSTQILSSMVLGFTSIYTLSWSHETYHKDLLSYDLTEKSITHFARTGGVELIFHNSMNQCIGRLQSMSGRRNQPPPAMATESIRLVTIQ